MRKYPIGIQNFRKIQEEDYLYVDKTEIVYQLLTEGVYYFLSRPRRFGKSLLLSTIKEIFLGSQELFKGLWIEKKWDWTKKNPVIHLSFNNIGARHLGLRDAISLLLKENAALLGIHLTAPSIDLQFKELIIKASEQGKVVLLIDEYDKPIIDYLNDTPKAQENRETLKEFYSIIKDADPYIRFLMITGVSKFSKVSIFSDLNNLEDITISEAMNDLVGITQQEVEGSFQEIIKIISVKFKISEIELLQKIRDWYNGYNWGGIHTLYNPFSILSFFKQQQFSNFWFETGTPTFLIEQIKRRNDFNFETLKTSQAGLSDFNIENINPTTLLFQTGYLTIKEYDDKRLLYTLSYPNNEVKHSLLQYLMGAYRYDYADKSMPLAAILCEAFEHNNIPEALSVINTVFSTIPSHLWQGATELHYHALVHLTFSLLGTYIQSEVNMAKGRCDALVKTTTHIYVLEFKLDKTPKEALNQIFDKGYLEPYKYDVQQKVAIGINFSSEHKKVESYLVKVV